MVFVGIAESLLERVVEQLAIREAPSVLSSSKLALEPAFLSELHWWEHSEFTDSDALRAAEFVASDLFDPVLRSRRPIGTKAAQLVENHAFRTRMHAALTAPPTGTVPLPAASERAQNYSRGASGH